jgi:hypothetical protein
MKGCASSQPEAAELLTAQMQEAAQKAADQAQADWQAKVDARDASGLNKIPPPDCNKCP